MLYAADNLRRTGIAVGAYPCRLAFYSAKGAAACRAMAYKFYLFRIRLPGRDVDINNLWDYFPTFFNIQHVMVVNVELRYAVMHV